MDDRDGSATTPLDRLRSRFGESAGSDDDDSAEESAWQRYGAVLQILLVVGAAFGGAIVSFASTAIDRTEAFARESGPALLGTLWPILVGVTLIAAVVCVVVVALGVRNV
ncbi:hypothetical protein [Halococcus saccharolyticus]|uniref:Uncharacterized protein n=1 Tax=Halococcus saccharolyticus DSM 5350 TaxID=1227455 RepID=M0MS60_9EURY|nr:hypothetical protein [Halococcus saccharolyticus]EMA47574.1 hypothetical protein C449_01371 [Halococcus saccharolyticus DSM 5350]